MQRISFHKLFTQYVLIQLINHLQEYIFKY